MLTADVTLPIDLLEAPQAHSRICYFAYAVGELFANVYVILVRTKDPAVPGFCWHPVAV